MIRLILSIIFFNLIAFAHSQEAMVGNSTYPEGLYKTKEDFIRRVPNDQVALVAKSLEGFKKEVIDTVPDQCLFYYKDNDKKVKKMFAVSYKGQLYIQAASVLLNRDKKDNRRRQVSHILSQGCSLEAITIYIWSWSWQIHGNRAWDMAWRESVELPLHRTP